MLLSLVTRGSPWARAVAAMIRSAGSLGKSRGNSVARTAISVVISRTLKAGVRTKAWRKARVVVFLTRTPPALDVHRKLPEAGGRDPQAGGRGRPADGPGRIPGQLFWGAVEPEGGVGVEQDHLRRRIGRALGLRTSHVSGGRTGLVLY